MVKKILFITLSNIGDAVLTLPSLDCLATNYPAAQITVISGIRPKGLFEDNPRISRFIAYDKHAGFSEKLKLLKLLRKERYDLIADLRNSFLGVILPAKYKISFLLNVPGNIMHMKDRHLYKISHSFGVQETKALKKVFCISSQVEDRVKKVFEENKIGLEDKIIVVAPGAKSHTKRWPKEKFAQLISRLVKGFPVKIVLVGDKEDIAINQYITGALNFPACDLTNQTSLQELAAVINKAALVISNDSATMHIASYLNIPTVAVFGITDDKKYGPWAQESAIVKKEIYCRPCAKAQCRFGSLECISLVQVEDVFLKASNILKHKPNIPNAKDYRRILVVRTDRIGDVVLSTPVLRALRDNYPDSYIAMVVSAQSKDIIDGNPAVDKVIIYDKDRQHKSWFKTFKFSRQLKKYKFDLAIILHPTNRAHFISFLAGIPKRVGYGRKSGFLLTDRLKHNKQYGQKHELEYNLDLLRYLDIVPKNKNLFVPLKEDSEKWVKELFEAEGIKPVDKLLVLHPAASCHSKIWPVENFAKVADILAEKYGFKVFIVAGAGDLKISEELSSKIKARAINLAAKTSISQLASLLKRCTLFISNDSGPVHIASAVGTPVISIFGRNQKGLSPKRWGPVGIRDKFLHKEIGCIECLAHNCQKEFACLKAISVSDVVSVADSILES